MTPSYGNSVLVSHSSNLSALTMIIVKYIEHVIQHVLHGSNEIIPQTVARSDKSDAEM